MIVVNYSFSFYDSTKNFIALFRAKNTAFHFLCSIHTIKKKILNIIMSCDKFPFNLLVKFVIQKYDKELTLSRCRWQKILQIFSFALIARSRNELRNAAVCSLTHQFTIWQSRSFKFIQICFRLSKICFYVIFLLVWLTGPSSKSFTQVSIKTRLQPTQVDLVFISTVILVSFI